jgi:hypothetical protein
MPGENHLVTGQRQPNQGLKFKLDHKYHNSEDALPSPLTGEQPNHKGPMHKKTKSILLALLVGAIAVPLIYAASVHFKGGSPTFSDQGTTLKTCFSLAGLGNGDVTITVKTTGTATTLCTNQGGNTAPGQNKTPVSPSGTATIPSTEIKNGNLTACVTTTPPPAPTAAEAGCPNSNWSTSLTDVQFATAQITVTQGGKIVLQQSFTL